MFYKWGNIVTPLRSSGNFRKGWKECESRRRETHMKLSSGHNMATVLLTHSSCGLTLSLSQDSSKFLCSFLDIPSMHISYYISQRAYQLQLP